jgi:pyrroloquinoline-quinone synthase
MRTLIQKIDSEIERRSLLKHNFYRMWSEGKLAVDHLQGYSKEYFQLVKAVPKFVQNISSFTTDKAIKEAMYQNLKEEYEHIEPWIRFANAIGIPTSELVNYIAANKTNAAVYELAQLTMLSLEESAAAMYAYEMELPKISRSKIDGLKKFYGINNNTNAVNYFEIHEEADIRHAATWRNIIQQTAPEKEKLAFNAAIESLQAQNKLLDSVQEKYLMTY